MVSIDGGGAGYRPRVRNAYSIKPCNAIVGFPTLGI